MVSMPIGRVRIFLHYIRPLGKIKILGRPRVPHVPRRIAAGVLFACTILGGCAAGPRLESVLAPAQPGVTLTDAGIRFTVLPNTWSAYPSDLWRYYTPVEMKVENARGEELQIRYEDFFALDDGNHQYRAVPPGEVARAVSGGATLYGPTHGPGATLLAGPWYPYWPRYWGPYYGPFAPWWYADPYYYSPYAWPRPAVQDVLTLGLREGRLLPGASVQGFLYFQQATARGNLLTLSWTPRLSSGVPLAPFAARFRILR